MSGSLKLIPDFECEEDSDSDSEEFESGCDRRCKKFSQIWLLVVTVSVVLGPVMLFVAHGSNDLHRPTGMWHTKHHMPLDDLMSNPISGATLALMIGYSSQMRLQASILVDISFGLVFLGTMTSTYIATRDWDKAPKDFRQKGTISNMAQSVAEPQGRLWTTSLALASILLTASMYTFWIYRPWYPLVGYRDNPLASSVLERQAERRARTAWALVPNVGFVLTAMVPSLSDTRDLNAVLAAVHNITAPLSMLFLMIMETVQLAYGENAFAYFFSTEPSNPVYGALTTFQRMRVILLLEAWTAGTVFVAVQGYLAFCPNRRHWVALVSYYGEVIGIILAFSLPAAAAVDIRMWQARDFGDVMEQTARVIPFIAGAGINDTLAQLMS